jgi:hypothetical protein
MRKALNILVWIVIGLLFIGTGVLIIWASHRPETRSIWAPDADPP